MPDHQLTAEQKAWRKRPFHPSEHIIRQIINDVAKLPDRTSPKNWPEAMLVTAEELRAILLVRLER